ncbi:ATP-binding protein [Thermomonospora cellulosilytica]|uniref:Anti-sigma regulatory factor (Ser/Thr protein kinase) n=1 Tax=Thermomonospora cellulosilytica TaxID=1411118 RepID=A0A7W3MTN5_9ACTN|nr:ATP-binding protein [Thermomonospora cellulosilytica]MBA9001690.1 anti-sigma regulatory factor (Ser/Thr protein kinase) [Thermomonospora cellulosilytica]
MTRTGVPERALSKRLPAWASAVPLARTYVRGRLTNLGQPREVIETAELIVSELATNAVVHRTGEVMTVFCGRRGHCLVVAVHDGSPEKPVPGIMPEIDPRRIENVPNDPGGWGLPLVQALSRAFWMDVDPEGGGKWVCAALNTGT